jgi:two-component system, LuxR family, response regulator FixJ
MAQPVGDAHQMQGPAKEIFIIDDNDEYRELLSAILTLEGFRVTGFANGTSFLREAASRTPVCIFLDVVMPGPSGLDVLKKLKAERNAAPVFLISARRDSPTVVEAMRNGARDFIEKPFDPYTAVLRVRDAVELWDRRAEKASKLQRQLLQFDVGWKLSGTEREVLGRIVAGASNAEIAQTLNLGRQSVANHRWRITRKLGARNSADLVRLVLANPVRVLNGDPDDV